MLNRRLYRLVINFLFHELYYSIKINNYSNAGFSNFNSSAKTFVLVLRDRSSAQVFKPISSIPFVIGQKDCYPLFVTHVSIIASVNYKQ